MMLEAEGGEEVWRRVDSESGPLCPRVHEVILQGESSWTGFEVVDLINTPDHCSKRSFSLFYVGAWNLFKPFHYIN